MSKIKFFKILKLILYNFLLFFFTSTKYKQCMQPVYCFGLFFCSSIDGRPCAKCIKTGKCTNAFSFTCQFVELLFFYFFVFFGKNLIIATNLLWLCITDSPIPCRKMHVIITVKCSVVCRCVAHVEPFLIFQFCIFHFVSHLVVCHPLDIAGIEVLYDRKNDRCLIINLFRIHQ